VERLSRILLSSWSTTGFKFVQGKKWILVGNIRYIYYIMVTVRTRKRRKIGLGLEDCIGASREMAPVMVVISRLG
jgi:hypothetical protein